MNFKSIAKNYLQFISIVTELEMGVTKLLFEA